MRFYVARRCPLVFRSGFRRLISNIVTAVARLSTSEYLCSCSGIFIAQRVFSVAHLWGRFPLKHELNTRAFRLLFVCVPDSRVHSDRLSLLLPFYRESRLYSVRGRNKSIDWTAAAWRRTRLPGFWSWFRVRNYNTQRDNRQKKALGLHAGKKRTLVFDDPMMTAVRRGRGADIRRVTLRSRVAISKLEDVISVKRNRCRYNVKPTFRKTNKRSATCNALLF